MLSFRFSVVILFDKLDNKFLKTASGYQVTETLFFLVHGQNSQNRALLTLISEYYKNITVQNLDYKIGYLLSTKNLLISLLRCRCQCVF